MRSASILLKGVGRSLWGNERITDIETAEFDTLIEAFIDRETDDMGEVDAPLFYEVVDAPLFYEVMETIYEEPADPTTVELEAQVVGSQLQLASPDSALSGVEVHDNEIMVNGIRFVIRLIPTEKA